MFYTQIFQCCLFLHIMTVHPSAFVRPSVCIALFFLLYYDCPSGGVCTSICLYCSVFSFILWLSIRRRLYVHLSVLHCFFFYIMTVHLPAFVRPSVCIALSFLFYYDCPSAGVCTSICLYCTVFPFLLWLSIHRRLYVHLSVLHCFFFCIMTVHPPAFVRPSVCIAVSFLVYNDCPSVGVCTFICLYCTVFPFLLWLSIRRRLYVHLSVLHCLFLYIMTVHPSAFVRPSVCIALFFLLYYDCSSAGVCTSICLYCRVFSFILWLSIRRRLYVHLSVLHCLSFCIMTVHPTAFVRPSVCIAVFFLVYYDCPSVGVCTFICLYCTVFPFLLWLSIRRRWYVHLSVLHCLFLYIMTVHPPTFVRPSVCIALSFLYIMTVHPSAFVRPSVCIALSFLLYYDCPSAGVCTFICLYCTVFPFVLWLSIRRRLYVYLSVFALSFLFYYDCPSVGVCTFICLYCTVFPFLLWLSIRRRLYVHLSVLLCFFFYIMTVHPSACVRSSVCIALFFLLYYDCPSAGVCTFICLYCTVFPFVLWLSIRRRLYVYLSVFALSFLFYYDCPSVGVCTFICLYCTVFPFLLWLSIRRRLYVHLSVLLCFFLLYYDCPSVGVCTSICLYCTFFFLYYDCPSAGVCTSICLYCMFFSFILWLSIRRRLYVNLSVLHCLSFYIMTVHPPTFVRPSVCIALSLLLYYDCPSAGVCTSICLYCTVFPFILWLFIRRRVYAHLSVLHCLFFLYYDCPSVGVCTSICLYCTVFPFILWLPIRRRLYVHLYVLHCLSFYIMTVHPPAFVRPSVCIALSFLLYYDCSSVGVCTSICLYCTVFSCILWLSIRRRLYVHLSVLHCLYFYIMTVHPPAFVRQSVCIALSFLLYYDCSYVGVCTPICLYCTVFSFYIMTVHPSAFVRPSVCIALSFLLCYDCPSAGVCTSICMYCTVFPFILWLFIRRRLYVHLSVLHCLFFYIMTVHPPAFVRPSVCIALFFLLYYDCPSVGVCTSICLYCTVFSFILWLSIRRRLYVHLSVLHCLFLYIMTVHPPAFVRPSVCIALSFLFYYDCPSAGVCTSICLYSTVFPFLFRLSIRRRLYVHLSVLHCLFFYNMTVHPSAFVRPSVCIALSFLLYYDSPSVDVCTSICLYCTVFPFMLWLFIRRRVYAHLSVLHCLFFLYYDCPSVGVCTSICLYCTVFPFILWLPIRRRLYVHLYVLHCLSFYIMTVHPSAFVRSSVCIALSFLYIMTVHPSAFVRPSVCIALSFLFILWLSIRRRLYVHLSVLHCLSFYIMTAHPPAFVRPSVCIALSFLLYYDCSSAGVCTSICLYCTVFSFILWLFIRRRLYVHLSVLHCLFLYIMTVHPPAFVRPSVCIALSFLLYYDCSSVGVCTSICLYCTVFSCILWLSIRRRLYVHLSVLHCLSFSIMTVHPPVFVRPSVCIALSFLFY